MGPRGISSRTNIANCLEHKGNMNTLLNKLADLKSEESVDDCIIPEQKPRLSPLPLPTRSIPSIIPRLQLDQLPMLPGFHQFRGFKYVDSRNHLE